MVFTVNTDDPNRDTGLPSLKVDRTGTFSFKKRLDLRFRCVKDGVKYEIGSLYIGFPK
ncbi:MAG: hypothetical protein OEW62_00805 [Candidatus Bathyarchaeota archaeon]|nr:hypothetical protein [Candidatus Bathyarchaeota archaeon]